MVSNSDSGGVFVWVLLSGWVICAAFASHFGGQRNSGGTGLFLGILFGPIGMIAAGLLDGRPRCKRCGGRQNVNPDGKRYPVCEHCGADNPLSIEDDPD